MNPFNELIDYLNLKYLFMANNKIDYQLTFYSIIYNYNLKFFY